MKILELIDEIENNIDDPEYIKKQIESFKKTFHPGLANDEINRMEKESQNYEGSLNFPLFAGRMISFIEHIYDKYF